MSDPITDAERAELLAMIERLRLYIDETDYKHFPEKVCLCKWCLAKRSTLQPGDLGYE